MPDRTLLSTVDADGIDRGTLRLAIAPGNSGDVFTSHGAGVSPTFQAQTGITSASAVTITAATTITLTAGSSIILTGIPSSDPMIVGALYTGALGALFVSAGP